MASTKEKILTSSEAIRETLAFKSRTLPIFVKKLVKNFRPLQSIPVWAKYGLTTVVIFTLFGLRLYLERYMFYSSYLVFLPGVILASLIFDRGTGYFSVILSATLAFSLLIHHHAFGSYVALVLYLLIGMFTAAVIEALRISLEMLSKVIRDLEESNKNLEESNRRLDDFVYIVSHDLKEPVRGINSFSSFLLEDFKGQLGMQGQNNLNKLKNIASHMDELISDLLKYCRAEKMDSGLEETELDQILKDIVELIKLQNDGDDVIISVDHPLPKIYCSKAHVAEIFRNLITNGIKYNDNRPKKINVGYTNDHQKRPGAHVFFVKDNGIGIPDSCMKDIFKIFKRLHGKGKYGGGTGTGLAIVKRLVELHHGEVWVESNTDGGSTFYFYVNCA